jgi:hypothetical protein
MRTRLGASLGSSIASVQSAAAVNAVEYKCICKEGFSWDFPSSKCVGESADRLGDVSSWPWPWAKRDCWEARCCTLLDIHRALSTSGYASLLMPMIGCGPHGVRVRVAVRGAGNGDGGRGGDGAHGRGCGTGSGTWGGGGHPRGRGHAVTHLDA